MAQRIQQIGAPQVYDPEGTPENPDWSRFPAEYWSNLQPVVKGVGSIVNPLTYPAVASGALVKGKQGTQWMADKTGLSDVGKFYKNYIDPVTYDYEEGGFGLDPTTEESGNASLLAPWTGAVYNEEQARRADPEYQFILDQQQNAYETSQKLKQYLDTATLKIGGAYNAAADQGRRTGENINTRGQATGNEIADYYGDAADFASDMSQAGGTSVSGLTGPSSAFQSIYGDSYGTGTGMSEAARSTASLASQDMMAEAQRAAGMGGTASKNLNRMWGTMTAREQQAMKNQMNLFNYEFKVKQNASASNLNIYKGMLNNILLGDNKDAKKNIKDAINVKTPADLKIYIDNITKQYGPAGAVESLLGSGLNLTQIGQ